MSLTTIEVLTVITVLVVAIKLLWLLLSLKSFSNFAKAIYRKPKLIKVIFLVLAGIILYFLLGAGMKITEIIAVSLFASMLMGIGFASYAEKLIEQIDFKHVFRTQWCYTLIWVILLVWGVWEIFC